MPQPLPDLTPYRRQPARTVLLLDFRRYRTHRGQLLYADRILLAGRWTPVVRVRLRQPRAADGATEI
ncbi:MAG TPA: hypothetical protein VFH66_11160 [Mycobacteriales bacterium]|nr:hypothetical protein [Mycobacteriales bacterium]